MRSRFDQPDRDPADDTFGPRMLDTSCLLCGTPMEVPESPEYIGQPTCDSCFKHIMARECRRLDQRGAA